MPTNPLRDQWLTSGYVRVPALFDPATTDRLRGSCESVLTQWRAHNPENGQPVADRNVTVMRHLNHPAYFRDNPAAFAALMDAVARAQVLDLARTLLDAEPTFYCTSLFMNPLDESKDGNWHRDSQFTTHSEEEEKAVVLGTAEKSGIQLQVALVPGQDIEIVPGSFARWDTPAEYAIRRQDNFAHNRSNHMPGALRLEQQPGDAAAFNPMGLHRGRYHADKTRRTLMLTYVPPTTTPDTYFSRQPWFMEEDYLRPLAPQTRAFFQRFIDVFGSYWRQPQAAK